LKGRIFDGFERESKLKIIKLYTKDDNKSYFLELDCAHKSEEPLGHYSKKYPASEIMFRDFEAGLFFDCIMLHNLNILFI